MTNFSYIDQPFTPEERELFCNNINCTPLGCPMKWLACGDEGVIVECESRVAMITWEEAQVAMTVKTVREIKKWCNDASEIISKYIYQ